jgi:hypothetical protein
MMIVAERDLPIALGINNSSAPSQTSVYWYQTRRGRIQWQELDNRDVLACTREN